MSGDDNDNDNDTKQRVTIMTTMRFEDTELVMTPALARPLVAISSILRAVSRSTNDWSLRDELVRLNARLGMIAEFPTKEAIITAKMDCFDLQGKARVAGYAYDADSLDGVGILFETIVRNLP